MTIDTQPRFQTPALIIMDQLNETLKTPTFTQFENNTCSEIAKINERIFVSVVKCPGPQKGRDSMFVFPLFLLGC